MEDDLIKDFEEIISKANKNSINYQVFDDGMKGIHGICPGNSLKKENDSFLQVTNDTDGSQSYTKYRRARILEEIKLLIKFRKDLNFIDYILPWYNISQFAQNIIETNYPLDFIWSPVISSEFYANLLYEGFLSLSDIVKTDIGRKTILLPKFHINRCCIHNKGIHIPKKVKKISKKFRFSINRAFHEVLNGCIKQHGESWLYPQLRTVLCELHQNNSKPRFKNVRVHSIEIWKDDELVAGEIGCSINRYYLSLTGFSTVDSSGTLQLCCLGILLSAQGFLLWDLGMVIKYKINLGAEIFKRKEFIELLKYSRSHNYVEHCLLSESLRGKLVDCLAIIASNSGSTFNH